jgi:hypothetical protein
MKMSVVSFAIDEIGMAAQSNPCFDSSLLYSTRLKPKLTSMGFERKMHLVKP